MGCWLFILLTINISFKASSSRSQLVLWFQHVSDYLRKRKTKYRATGDNIISWRLKFIHYWSAVCSTCYRFHENKARDHPHYGDWAVAQAAVKLNRKLLLFVSAFQFILCGSLTSPSREVTLLIGVWEPYRYCCTLTLFITVKLNLLLAETM